MSYLVASSGDAFAASFSCTCNDLVRLLGTLESLPVEFMPRQVIFFSMVFSGGTMSVCGKVTEFSSFPM